MRCAIKRRYLLILHHKVYVVSNALSLINLQSASNVSVSTTSTYGNLPQVVAYPVVMDSEAGIVIRFKKKWNTIEYHEGRIIVYRDENGRISIIEIDYFEGERVEEDERKSAAP